MERQESSNMLVKREAPKFKFLGHARPTQPKDTKDRGEKGGPDIESVLKRGAP